MTYLIEYTINGIIECITIERNCESELQAMSRVHKKHKNDSFCMYILFDRIVCLGA